MFIVVNVQSFIDSLAYLDTRTSPRGAPGWGGGGGGGG